MSVLIAPSILSADFAALGEAVAAIERGGADLIHVDVMDGHFVPNITIGPPVVRSLKRVATVPLDVHLMITDPDRYIEAFVEAGAAMMSVHVEVLPHLHRTVHAIKALGAKAGVVLNPVDAGGGARGDRRRRRLRARHVGQPRLRRPDASFPAASARSRQCVRCSIGPATSAPVEIDGGIDRAEHRTCRGRRRADHRRRIGGVPVGRSRARALASSRRPRSGPSGHVSAIPAAPAKGGR